MVNSIYCSNEKIQIVTGNTTKNNINVNSYKEIVLPEGTLLNGVILDSETMKIRLEEELKNSAIQDREINLVLDSTSILTKMIKVPSLSSEDVYKIIKMEFETARNKEEFVYDYHVINQKNPDGGATIFACAVAKTFAQAYVNLFKSIGYRVISIDIVQSAVIKLVENFDLFKDETCTLIINDGSNIILNLFVNGVYMLSTRYRLLEELGSTESINEILGRISVHTQFIATQKLEYKISKIYFCGNYGEGVDISSSLKNVLDIDSSNLAFGNILNNSDNKNICEYIYAVGNIISLKKKSINLIKQLSVDHEKKEKQKKFRMVVFPIVGLVVVFIGIYLTIFISKMLIDNKIDTLNSYISDSQNLEKYNEYLSYKQQSNNYTKILTELENQDIMMTNYPDLGSGFFGIVEQCASGLMTINQMSYRISEEGIFSLEITGVADNVPNIVNFIGNLENNNIVYQNNGYYLTGSVYEFSVICILEPKTTQE